VQGCRSLLIIKTVGRNFRSLIERVKNLHPYSVRKSSPFPVAAGSAPYLSWVQAHPLGPPRHRS